MTTNYTVEQIYNGVKLAYKKMLEQKSVNDEDIIVSENGKIVRLKAKEVLEELRLKGEL